MSIEHEDKFSELCDALADAMETTIEEGVSGYGKTLPAFTFALCWTMFLHFASKQGCGRYSLAKSTEKIFNVKSKVLYT
jgi:hypothetical protein